MPPPSLIDIVTNTEAMKPVRACIRLAYVRNNIPAVVPHMKLTMHTLALDTSVTQTQLKDFFPEYMQDIKTEDIGFFETTETADGITLSITTPHGNVWMNAFSDAARLNIIMDCNRAITIQVTRTRNDIRPVLILTHIDPFKCAFCGCASTHKCKKCWDNLNISVRYCGKECQRAHFQQGHKRVCGKRG